MTLGFSQSASILRSKVPLARATLVPRACARRNSSSATAAENCPMPSALSRRAYRPTDRVVLYDGVCGLCNGGVQLLLKADTEGILRYAALQSEAGRALLQQTGAPDDLSTVVFVDGGKAYTYSDAVLRIGEALPGLSIPAKLALMLIPRAFRDWFYTHVVANNRYWVFGRNDTCILMQPGYEDRFLE